MNRTIFITLLILISAFFWTANMNAASNDNPETVQGVSTEKIEEIFAIYESSDAPGCAVSVYSEGNEIYKNTFGLSNLDYGIALSDSSAFYMASVSKQVTAAAAGLLVIRGELDDTAPVSDYIEEWPDYASDVQVHHLFSHTSGLPDIYGLMEIAGVPVNNPMDIEDYMELIRHGESLKFSPGTDYAYTNSGYTTLAHLVEIISEKPFFQFVEDEFFKPLGMSSTHFHSDRLRVIPNRVISYRPGEEQFRRTYLGMFQGVGPGGLYSTLNDWAKWEAFWYGSLDWDGGITVEEASELKSLMVTPAIADGEELDYGWGLHIEKRKGQLMIGHGGSFMGFRTDYRRYPDHGYSFLTLCNRGDAEPRDFNDRLADLFLQDDFEAYLAPYGGTYRNDELPIEYELTVEEGNLNLIRRNSPNGAMTEDAEDIWRAGSWDFVFERSDEGQITGFVVSTGRARDVEFTKINGDQL
ncbi:serine hydrolase [Rhodohalobacter sp. SW132]|uniref:serine hydrolase domain-containing protein n=1 Tax=Rhodohalobacter sp. SW132 TaxID=2293433 RepID=UPI0013142277|nr:serine hydrolase domain-containing protein [Rhodohalobacter sp. SW132]